MSHDDNTKQALCTTASHYVIHLILCKTYYSALVPYLQAAAVKDLCLRIRRFWVEIAAAVTLVRALHIAPTPLILHIRRYICPKSIYFSTYKDIFVHILRHICPKCIFHTQLLEKENDIQGFFSQTIFMYVCVLNISCSLSSYKIFK